MTRPASDPWREVSAARMPATGLIALAPVRDREAVRVFPAGETAWVRWPAGQAEVVRCLLPVPGIVFYAQHEGLWFRFGRSVPTDETPSNGDGVSVASVLLPGRFEPLPATERSSPPVLLSVVRGGEAKQASAISCTINELAKWADAATTAELAAVRGARSGERAVLLGEKLPALAGAVRYWGKRVFVPLGFRAEPDLPESALREAVGVSGEELLLLDEAGAEVIPLAAFETLTRAGVRLGARLP